MAQTALAWRCVGRSMCGREYALGLGMMRILLGCVEHLAIVEVDRSCDVEIFAKYGLCGNHSEARCGDVKLV